jgi:UDP-N-acetylmuramoyl-L-alanyl-D-glutamate--2,6-diaminopimelate ligase
VILAKLYVEAMQLEYITKLVQPIRVRGTTQREIEGIAYDSRQVRPGYVFVALPGRRADGRAFMADAVKRGAVAVVTEGECEVPLGAVCLCVSDARQALAEMACAFYGNPSQRLRMIGITGTNGKTTTSYFCRDILTAAGYPAGLIGTISYQIGQRRIPAARTTPEAPDIQAMLDQIVRGGGRAAVMEVSSHGLDQKRVWGIDFDVGVFTNLSQDHLDYHGTMERYFAAKAQLFRSLGQMSKKAWAVINMDDSWGMRLADTGGWNAELVTYGLHPNAVVRAENVELSAEGSVFRLVTPCGAARVKLALPGAFNVSNALAAAAGCGVFGIPLDVMASALEGMRCVPGRLERVPVEKPFRVFVDYAHTPDALENVLETLRAITARRLIVVFGCGGDRDRGKRPLMGAVAARLADYVILTSDNPRREDPESILKEIEQGIPPGAPVEKFVNREEAIFRALQRAGDGDIVLIAGKGHETYQEFADTVVPFDDREVVKRLISNL